MPETQTGKNIIESRHPLYDAASLDRWQSAYVAGREYAQTRLAKHYLEKDASYDGRKEASIPKPTLARICTTYATYLFAKQWTIAADQELIDDCDRCGTPFQQWLKDQSRWLACDGYGAIGVDSPALPDNSPKPLTRADASKSGIRPYLYYIRAIDLLDWTAGEDGALVECLLRIRRFSGRIGSRPKNADERFEDIYRLWTTEEVFDFSEKGELIAQYPNAARPFIPIVPVRFHDTGDPVVGMGLGAVIEPIQTAILQRDSWLGEILARQTFSQLVAQGSAEEYGDVKRLGTSSLFLYPENKNAPQYISPDAGQATLLQSEIDNLTQIAWQLAGLRPPKAMSAPEQAMSGLALGWQFLDTNQSLADPARNMASAAKRALLYAAKFGGSVSEKIEVIPPSDFGIKDGNAEAATLTTVLQGLKQSGQSKVLCDRIEVSIARALYPEDEKLFREIEKELAEIPKYEAPEPAMPFEPNEDDGAAA